MRWRFAVVALAIGFVVAATTRVAAEEPKIVFRIFDNHGNPLAGARIGNYADWSERVGKIVGTEGLGRPPQALFIGGSRGVTIESDIDGRATVPASAVFRESSEDRSIAIYAVHLERKLCALVEVTRTMAVQTIELRLEPACEVRGELTSTGLQDIGRKLSWTNLYVYWNNHRPLMCMSENQQFRLMLPSGIYKFNAYGTDAYEITQEIEIAAGQSRIRHDAGPSGQSAGSALRQARSGAQADQGLEKRRSGHARAAQGQSRASRFLGPLVRPVYSRNARLDEASRQVRRQRAGHHRGAR